MKTSVSRSWNSGGRPKEEEEEDEDEDDVSFHPSASFFRFSNSLFSAFVGILVLRITILSTCSPLFLPTPALGNNSPSKLRIGLNAFPPAYRHPNTQGLSRSSVSHCKSFIV